MLAVYMTLSQKSLENASSWLQLGMWMSGELEKYIRTGRVQKLNHCSACSASAIAFIQKQYFC